MKPIYVYIAGPYTKPDPAINTARAIHTADWVRDMGMAPFCPHLTHFWHMIHEHDWDYWIALALEWLAVCDVVLRLPGESAGAEREEAEARRLGLPVVGSIEELSEMRKEIVRKRASAAK